MIGFSTVEEYWDDRFEKKEKQKTSFSNKIIIVGLILFVICTVVNTLVRYEFFNLLNKL